MDAIHLVKMPRKTKGMNAIHLTERTQDQRDGCNPSNRKDARTKGWMQSI